MLQHVLNSIFFSNNFIHIFLKKENLLFQMVTGCECEHTHTYIISTESKDIECKLLSWKLALPSLTKDIQRVSWGIYHSTGTTPTQRCEDLESFFRMLISQMRRERIHPRWRAKVLVNCLYANGKNNFCNTYNISFWYYISIIRTFLNLFLNYNEVLSNEQKHLNSAAREQTNNIAHIWFNRICLLQRNDNRKATCKRFSFSHLFNCQYWHN